MSEADAPTHQKNIFQHTKPSRTHTKYHITKPRFPTEVPSRTLTSPVNTTQLEASSLIAAPKYRSPFSKHQLHRTNRSALKKNLQPKRSEWIDHNDSRQEKREYTSFELLKMPFKARVSVAVDFQPAGRERCSDRSCKGKRYDSLPELVPKILDSRVVLALPLKEVLMGFVDDLMAYFDLTIYFLERGSKS